MVHVEPPYPLAPRYAPAEMGRQLPCSTLGAWGRLLALLLAVSGFLLLPWALFAMAALFLFVAVDAAPISRLFGFLICTLFGMIACKGWMARRQSPPPTLNVLSDQPVVEAFVRRVAEDIHSPAPRWLMLDSGTTLNFTARVGPWHFIRAPEWELHVGLWLWQQLSLSEFKALIARTLAPLSRGRRERWRLVGTLFLDGFFHGSDALDDLAQSNATGAGFARLIRGCYWGIGFPVWWWAKGWYWLARLPDLELANDLVGVRIAGSDALVHGVFHADSAGLFLERLNEELVACRREGICSQNLYAHQPDALKLVREQFKDDTFGELPVLRGVHAGKYVDVFDLNQQYHSDVWDGLPLPSSREANAKRTFILAEFDERPASLLLNNLSSLERTFSEHHYEEILHADVRTIYLPPDTVRRWLAVSPETPFLPKYGGLYDEGRLIEPGTREERETALLTYNWDDRKLLNAAATIYARVGPVAQRWQTARKALRKLLRKALYRPSRRERYRAEDLEDERLKTGKWLAAIDQRAYVIHVHMASRLPDLALHEALLQQYRSVLRLQSYVSDAREFRDRTVAFVEALRETLQPSYALERDAEKEFRRSRIDFENFMNDLARIDDPLLLAHTGNVPLTQFVYAREGPAHFRRDHSGRRLAHAWDEVARKTDWLHYLGVTALLELHEQIVDVFTTHTALTLAEATNETMLELVDEEPSIE